MKSIRFSDARAGGAGGGDTFAANFISGGSSGGAANTALLGQDAILYSEYSRDSADVVGHYLDSVITSTSATTFTSSTAGAANGGGKSDT